MSDMQVPAKVRVSLQEGSIEISGSEEFVREQMDIYQDFLLERLENIPVQQHNMLEDISSSKRPRQEVTNSQEERPEDDLDTYEHIYVIQGEKVDLLLNGVPGDSTREQMVNLAFLYLFGKHLADVEEVSTNEIRDLCKEFAILDGPNFMKALRSDRRNLQLIKKSARTYNIKLTRPGIAHAKELIQEIE